MCKHIIKFVHYNCIVAKEIKLAAKIAVPIAVHRVYYEETKKNDAYSLGELRELYLNTGLFTDFEGVLFSSLTWLEEVEKKRGKTGLDIILRKELISALACLYAEHFSEKLDHCFFFYLLSYLIIIIFISYYK
jgi:hypothetical protein